MNDTARDVMTGHEFPWGDSLEGIPRCPQAQRHADELVGDEVAHVGVLFVHGVGFQSSGEIFRSSVAPLVRVLREAGFVNLDPLNDPVRIASEALPSSDLPFIELDLPRSGSNAREHWAITEAWWAASFEPPSFSTMFGWLGAQGKAATAAQRIQPPRPRTLDRLPKRPARSLPLQLILNVFVSLLLAIYAVLRTIFAVIPLQGLRERLIGSVDRFVQEWAGDMRVLLLDEAQAGMVRFRIARAIRALQAYGCKSVVVVAHSGGAVASYMTLTDDEYRHLPVRTLVTYGSGLNIAWRLLGFSADTPTPVARAIGGPLGRKLPHQMFWCDYWATDDPVPAGPVDDAPRAVSRPLRGAEAPRARGHRISNRWNLVGDHGTYFDNDEEFVIPLAESIDDRVRPPDGVRLFDHWPDPARKIAISRRLERVAALSMWRRWTAVCGIFAIFGAIATGLLRFWLDRDPGLSQPLMDLTDYVQAVIRDLLGRDQHEAVSRPENLLPVAPNASQWLIDALTLTGHVGWITVLGVLAYLLKPEGRDWLSAMADRPRMRAVSWALSLIIWLVLVFTALVGIPSLLGVSLESSAVWKFGWFTDIRGGFAEFTRGLDRVWRDGLLNLYLAIVSLMAGGLGLAILYRMVASSRKRLWRSFAADAVVMAVGTWLLASLVFAAAASSAFRSNLLGWAVILMGFSVINRIGQWRWKQWDELERWELRSKIAGVNKTRRAGRKVDAVVFALLVAASLVLATGIALRPLFIDTANSILIVGAATLVAGIFLGLAQDEVNGSAPSGGEGLPGAAPTPVSQTARGS